MRTLTRREHPRHPLAPRIETAPLRFDGSLDESLRGADTLYNTYWIRFERGEASFDRVGENTIALFRAAERAGVRRIVHVSVSNPSEDSPLPYFRGKARIERWLEESGLPHAIVRPTLVFGRDDILVNNIAWILRRFPLFVVPGDGGYRVQPVSVADTARIAVEAEGTVDAAGPDTFTFEELVRAVARAVASRARVAHASPRVALALTRVAGLALRDVVLTREEVAGLMDGLLVSHEPPRGTERFDRWLAENASVLGLAYVSELERNFRAPV